MRKKRRNLFVLLCLCAFALMAIGSSSSDSGDKKDIVSSGDKSDNDKSSSTNKKVTIEQQVLFEKENIKVTALEYVTNSIMGDGIKLQVENNSGKAVSVSCKALVVNNFMINELFVANVAAGKKVNETMYLSSSQLEAAGIERVGQVEIYFHVYESDTFEDIFDTDCMTIKTSQYENMDTTPDDTGVELYNEDGIKIVGKAVDEDSFWGKTIVLYCENNSGKDATIQVKDLSINGFMINPIFSLTIYDGKMAVDAIDMLSSDLEENGIEAIKDVELKFRIFEGDSFLKGKDTDVIKFSVK